VQPLFSLSGCLFFSGSAFLVFCLPTIPPLFFFSLSTVITVWRVPGCPCVWGLMAGLRGLLAMGASYCLGAGWSQWRALDIPGTHLPLSSMQLLMKIICGVQCLQTKLCKEKSTGKRQKRQRQEESHKKHWFTSSSHVNKLLLGKQYCIS